ncbi:MAG: DUF1461 domain-containing protein [Candidatus Aenigmatarchaeota archaeon]|nr:DUF1461 domain-containing protein [Candidatus Aenigmarchaeota archaeon]
MKLNKFSKVIFVLSILKGIFVVSLILSLFLWSVPILSFNSDIWLIFQERSGVILDFENARNYNELIVEFFKTGLNLEFLNEKELSHMKDVKTVITIANVLFIFSFISLISGFSYFSKSQRKFLLKALRKTSLFVFVITLIFSVIILTNFHSSFMIFHKIIFIRNFVFPADSLLKILYPDEFFYGLSALYLLSVLIVSFIVAVISHRLKLK